MTVQMTRIVVAILAVAYLATAAWVYLIQPAPAGSTLAQMEAPLRWAGSQPVVWEQVGRMVLFDPVKPDPARAETAFLRAAQGNSMEPQVWTDLADTYEQIGDTQKAEQALRTAILVYPHSPTIAWRLANALILQGRTTDALPLLRMVAESDRLQRRAVYDLAWKLLDSGDEVIKSVVPEDLDSRSDYLIFMLEKRQAKVPVDVWRELRKGNYFQAAALGGGLVDTLLANGRFTEALVVWNELLDYTGRSGAHPQGTLMTNGDFEFDLPGYGLDWHIDKDPHWSASLDSFTAHSGTRSLLLTFDNRSNPEFNGLWQLVIVEPNRDYLLRASIRTDSVTSDTGFRLIAGSWNNPPSETFVVLGPNHIDSGPWTEDVLRFHTGPKTWVVRVGLHRSASQKLYGLLGGKVWIDSVTLDASK